MVGHHLLRTWSPTQPVVAMSSAEAEYYAMVDGAPRGLGVWSMLNELGARIQYVYLHTDSSAAKAFISRRGFGRMRHMEVKQLWLQECVKQGTIKLIKIAGNLNPADLMTKFHDLNGLLIVSEGLLWVRPQTEGLGRRGRLERIGVSPRSLYIAYVVPVFVRAMW